MQQLLNFALAPRRLMENGDVKVLVSVALVIVGIFVAIYALTTNPNDATGMIGFFP